MIRWINSKIADNIFKVHGLYYLNVRMIFIIVFIWFIDKYLIIQQLSKNNWWLLSIFSLNNFFHILSKIIIKLCNLLQHFIISYRFPTIFNTINNVVWEVISSLKWFNAVICLIHWSLFLFWDGLFEYISFEPWNFQRKFNS